MFSSPGGRRAAAPGVELVADHAAAAVAAFRHGRPCCSPRERGISYLTSRNPVVLACPWWSVYWTIHNLWRDAVERAFARKQVIAGRGPFSVDDNRRHIRACGAGVLVTKDSGAAGGTAEKLQAARAEGCEVIVIARPALGDRQGFTEIDSLLAALAHALAGPG